MDNNLQRILYIAGYSRSGSTILDMMLNSHDDVISTGELTYLQSDALNADRMCTCGEPYQSCTRYGHWLEDRPATEAALIRKIEERAGVKTLLNGNVSEHDQNAYRAYAQSLFAEIGSDASVIVDSSKSAHDAAGRPFALARLAGLDVRVLHLSRSPRSTIRSYLDKGSNWALEGHQKPRALESWRPIVGWTLANSLAAKVGKALGEDHYLHVRLEDLLTDPKTTMDRIGHFAGLDLSGVSKAVLAGEAFSAGHSVGGNRARLTPQKIELSVKPSKPLPMGHSLGLRVFGGRVMRDLGYV